MPESPVNTPVNPRAADLAIVAEKFPHTFCVIKTPYRRADRVGGDKPVGYTRMLVQTIWEDLNGKVSARVSHPIDGDKNLVWHPNSTAPEPHTLAALRDAEIERIPTEATIRDMVIEVVNRQWNDTLDATADNIAALGALKAEFAALQHRVGALPGLEAVARLEAALTTQQTQVQGALKQVQGLADTIHKKVDERLAKADQDVRDLHARLTHLDGLLRTLLDSTPSLPEPEPVPIPAEEREGQEVLVRGRGKTPRELLEDMNYGALRGFAKSKGLTMPPTGTSLVDARKFLLEQIKE